MSKSRNAYCKKDTLGFARLPMLIGALCMTNPVLSLIFKTIVVSSMVAQHRNEEKLDQLLVLVNDLATNHEQEVAVVGLKVM